MPMNKIISINPTYNNSLKSTKPAFSGDTRLKIKMINTDQFERQKTTNNNFHPKPTLWKSNFTQHINAVLNRQNETNPQLKCISTFEDAKLYKAGKFDVVSLKGDYYQMGLQYGQLQKEQIKSFHKDIVCLYKELGLIRSLEEYEKYALKLFNDYPFKYKVMLDGIAKGSDMDIEEIAMINVFMEVIEAKCSCIVSGGEYSDKQLNIMGRNFDYPEFFKKFSKYLTLVTLKPDNGSNAVALLAYAGQITAAQLFNDKGLAIEVNDAIVGSDNERKSGQVPFVLNNLDAMHKSSTLEELDKELKTNGAACPIIFNVADNQNAYCYEITTSSVKRRTSEKDGLLVSTNHFINKDWPKAVLNFWDIKYKSILRRTNLLNQAELNKGSMTIQTMKDILDKKIEAGGATFPEKTIFQFVFSPKDQELHLKARGYSDWTAISLKELFN